MCRPVPETFSNEDKNWGVRTRRVGVGWVSVSSSKEDSLSLTCLVVHHRCVGLGSVGVKVLDSQF